VDVKEYHCEMVRGSVLRWQCGRKITTGGWRWEEGIGGLYRRTVAGGSNREDGNGRMEPREYNRENATGRMEGIAEACPPPDTGRGRGPQDTSSAKAGRSRLWEGPE
jgi:hypothetical protein